MKYGRSDSPAAGSDTHVSQTIPDM